MNDQKKPSDSSLIGIFALTAEDEDDERAKVKSYGPELLVNGNFNAGDVNWIKGVGWTIEPDNGGFLAKATAAPVNSMLEQNGRVTVGKTYKVEFSVLDFVLGGVWCRLGLTYGTARYANGTYVQEIVCTTNTDFSIKTTNASNTYSIDNVSIKEVIWS